MPPYFLAMLQIYPIPELLVSALQNTCEFCPFVLTRVLHLNF